MLYGFLQWSGLLGRLAKAASAEAEAKVKNIARFFEVVKGYGDVAEHDRVPAFVAHLELLREAGDDPAVAEAELDEDAVHVLTVHKAKGLEFPVVFLVGCAESKFPLQRRGDALGLPEALVKEELTGGVSGHMLEERRLFYVAMTRAMDELVLTSAADYGTARARKLSRFVVEALDLPSPRPLSRRTAPLEALAREAPAPEPKPPVEGEIPEDELLRLSYRQIDDYETCPLKYRYLHVLRVPLLAHHAVVYGHAVHEAVRSHFESRLAGRESDADTLVAAFRKAWVSEGFLSREHEEERRREGEAMLRRFHAEEARQPWHPVAVEEEFAFPLERNRVQGRYDLVLEEAGETTIVDFKTGDVREAKAAERRARESLQLDIYALAQLRTKGRLPDRVELRFLETGLVGSRRPTPQEATATEARIRRRGGRHPHPRVPGASHVLRVQPVSVPRDLPPYRLGRTRGVAEHEPEDRIRGAGPDGEPDGPEPAQEGLHDDGLEPHGRALRAARRGGRPGRGDARASWRSARTSWSPASRTRRPWSGWCSPRTACWPRARPGFRYLECSTVDASTTRRVQAALRERGADALEAPVTGSKNGAENATLLFMTGGERAVHDELLPVMMAMGTKAIYCGEMGQGSTMKLIGNSVISLMLEALCEGIVVGRRAGVPLETILEVIQASGFASPYYSFKARRHRQARLQRALRDRPAGEGPDPDARDRRGAARCRCPASPRCARCSRRRARRASAARTSAPW